MTEAGHLEYLEQCRRRWAAAIQEAVGQTPPTTSTWIDQEAIAEAIQPFVRAVNHLHLASGGGVDIAAVGIGREPGTIVLRPQGRLAYIAKPRSMTLEYISAKPAESFIVFELEELMPSGVYDDVDSPFSEEIVEISRGVYAPRSAWDDGFYGYDENGDEIPLPEEARRIQRLFCGRLMMVTKGSLWNGSQLTYAGEHNYLANDAIRAQIERAVASGLPKLDPADRQHINARKRGSQQ